MDNNHNPLNLPETVPVMPEHETPCHRLAEHSADYLSDTELLSLLLNSNKGPEASLQIARKLIATHGSLNRLMSLSLTELKRFPGIGTSGACAIQGALGLARRLQRAKPSERPLITTPQEVAGYMRPVIAHLQQEEFHALLLDTKHHLLRDCMITRGLVDRSQVHAREVFRPAIQESCSRIILVHNHPSGDPTPSSQDISCNNNLVAAGRLVGIEVLDHVIIGEATQNRFRYWLSLKEEGLMK